MRLRGKADIFRLTWLTALSLAICLLEAGASHGNGPDDGDITPLRNFVDDGKLHPGVKKEIDRTGQAELLLILDEGDIQAVAAGMRKAAGADHDTTAIVREKARLFAKKKSKVLSGIPPHGVSVVTDYAHFPVIHVRANENALARLLSMSEVAFAAENSRVLPLLAESLPLIGAPQAQGAGAGGNGTAVAVLDTGINYALGAFGGCTAPGDPAPCKVAYMHDFAPDDGNPDDDGHGTNVAGIVAGVAPDARLLGLDVFRTDGYAYYSDILAALDWVLANRAAYNIVAINMSLGGDAYSSPCSSDGLASAVSNLKSAGVTSVIASGNEKYTNALAAPACVPEAVSVGAVYDANVGGIGWGAGCTDHTTAPDKVTCFSNSASFLTMLAPGALITAAGTLMGGTSQATPHVAGAVAVLKGQYADLTVDNVVSRLTGTGVAVTDGRNGIIKPRLALYGALQFARTAATPTGHEFGNVIVGGASPVETFTIANAGMADLTIGSITINPVGMTGTAPNDFASQNDSCSGRTLAPSATCAIEARMTPQSAGMKAAFLSIPSNDPFTPTLKPLLSGTAQTPYTLTVGRGGTGTGTVTGNPAGITCGSDCSEPYAAGTAVTLTAAPDGNSTFAGWSGGGCSGVGACTATISADATVTATFTVKPPVAGLLAAPVSGGAPLYVAFTDTSANNPTAWLWSFGDGTADSARNPGHMYASPGTYTVALTAANSSGSSSATAVDYVTVLSCVNPPVRISSATPVYYPLLQSAYDYAAGGDILQVQAMDLGGDLSLDRDIVITLQGGFDCGYTGNPAAAAMLGKLRAANGTVKIEKVRFK